MNITLNDTTTHYSLCSATVIAATTWDLNDIYTLELVYPRYIHAEFLRHRAFSMSVQSSRATPTPTLIDLVRWNPVVPLDVYENRSGMVGGSEVDSKTWSKFCRWWCLGAKCAAFIANRLYKLGVHKQHANRVLEPYLPVRQIVTATDWENFFNLRLAEDAQPEIRDLAKAMYQAMKQAEKIMRKTQEWHHPYVTDEEWKSICKSDGLDAALLTSAARCARVSYYKHDGKKPSLDEDIGLGKRLIKDKHFSPLEHVAHQRPGRHANFWGWQSYRNHKGE